MMKVITGEKLNTSLGLTVVVEEPSVSLNVGEQIIFEGKTFTIVEIISPSKPNGKWAIIIE